MKVSVVIPAYNEQDRLESTLTALIDTFQNAGWDACDWEIVVVDDGSQDATWLVVQACQRRWSVVRGIRLSHNQGKGQALRRGVLQARGDVVVVYDADAATPPVVILEYISWIAEDACDIIVGSRELGIRMGRQVRYSKLRRVLGHIFMWRVHRLVPGFLDTQCGFKLLKRSVARHLFSLLQQQGYAWDVELLALALRLGYRPVEVPIDWEHRPGSKVRVLRDGWRMMRSISQIRKRLEWFHEERWVGGPSCMVCSGSAWIPLRPLDPTSPLRCAVCELIRVPSTDVVSDFSSPHCWEE